MSDKSEDSVSLNLAQVHTGDANEAKDGHQHFQRVVEVDIDRGD